MIERLPEIIIFEEGIINYLLCTFHYLFDYFIDKGYSVMTLFISPDTTNLTEI